MAWARRSGKLKRRPAPEQSSDQRAGKAFADARGSSTYTVHDANFTGGQGGTVDGGQPVDGNGTIANNYQGGTGGEGITSQSGATTTINSGMFTGGVGGYGLEVGGGEVTLFGTFTVNGVADYTGAIMPGNGTITGSFDNGATDETFTYDVNGGVLNVVPEPSTWAAVLCGAGMLGLALRRRAARA